MEPQVRRHLSANIWTAVSGSVQRQPEVLTSFLDLVLLPLSLMLLSVAKLLFLSCWRLEGKAEGNKEITELMASVAGGCPPPG